MSIETSQDIPSLQSVTAEEWSKLGERRVFFGHQSVGRDLLAGVADILADRPDIPLQVVETADPGKMVKPAFYHARIGANEAPLTKLEAFRDIVSQGEIASEGTGLLKYCYLDVTPGTDPRALFETYRQTVDSLRSAHPGLTIVHVTMPLTIDSGWLRHVVAKARGRFPVRERNHIRQQYNELIRSEFGDSDPIFDLARYESIGPDGRMRVVEYGGESVPVLAPEWTYDGGHLNEAGRRRIAEALLVTLAKS